MASDETPAAADPDDVLGIKPPPLGIEPMGLAPIATPQVGIDRIELQVAGLPRHRQVSWR